MEIRWPRVVISAGINGAGKPTAAEALLVEFGIDTTWSGADGDGRRERWAALLILSGYFPPEARRGVILDQLERWSVCTGREDGSRRGGFRSYGSVPPSNNAGSIAGPGVVFRAAENQHTQVCSDQGGQVSRVKRKHSSPQSVWKHESAYVHWQVSPNWVPAGGVGLGMCAATVPRSSAPDAVVSNDSTCSVSMDSFTLRIWISDLMDEGWGVMAADPARGSWSVLLGIGHRMRHRCLPPDAVE